jgi:hypothetical protein
VIGVLEKRARHAPARDRPQVLDARDVLHAR